MWEVKIKVLNVAKKLAAVSARRIPIANEDEYLYSCTAILDSAAQRSAVLNQIKNNYLAYINREGQIDIIIAGMENTATNALNTWENTL